MDPQVTTTTDFLTAAGRHVEARDKLSPSMAAAVVRQAPLAEALEWAAAEGVHPAPLDHK